MPTVCWSITIGSFVIAMSMRLFVAARAAGDRGDEVLGRALAVFGNDERCELGPDELVQRVARQCFARRIGADESALVVERIDRVGVVLEQRPVALLAFAEALLGFASFGDVLEEDREAAGVRENAVVEPPAVRRVIRFELPRLAFADGAFVLVVERLVDAFGELGPDVFADERRRGSAEHSAGVLVDVAVAPVGVERDESVARGLEHAGEGLAGLLGLAAPADELRDE
jgi:hypothetical protein